MFGLQKIIISCALSAILSGYLVSQYQINTYEAKISTMTLLYEETLRVETEKVLQKERTLNDLNNKIEVITNEKQDKIKSLEDRVSKLVADGSIRMRDPGNRTKTCPTAISDTKSTKVSNDGTGSELSEEFTRFLWSEASRADRITEQLNSCQLYIESLIKNVNPEKK